MIIRIHGTKKGRLRMWSQGLKSMEVEKKRTKNTVRMNELYGTKKVHPKK